MEVFSMITPNRQRPLSTRGPNQRDSFTKNTYHVTWVAQQLVRICENSPDVSSYEFERRNSLTFVSFCTNIINICTLRVSTYLQTTLSMRIYYILPAGNFVLQFYESKLRKMNPTHDYVFEEPPFETRHSSYFVEYHRPRVETHEFIQ